MHATTRRSDTLGGMHLVLASRSPARRATLLSAGITPIVMVSDVDENEVLRRLNEAFSSSSNPSHEDPSPADQVLALAQAKCLAVADRLACASLDHTAVDEARAEDRTHEDLIVVGCDSMFELDGVMYGKPHNRLTAIERIRSMQGRSGTLWTGHYVALLTAQSHNSIDEESASPLAGVKPSRAPEPAANTPKSTDVAYQVARTAGRSASTTVYFGSMTDEEIKAYVDSGEPLEVAGSFTIDGLGGAFVRGVEGDPHSVVGISLPLLRSMLAELDVFWPDLWDQHNRPNGH